MNAATSDGVNKAMDAWWTLVDETPNECANTLMDALADLNNSVKTYCEYTRLTFVSGQLRRSRVQLGSVLAGRAGRGLVLALAARMGEYDGLPDVAAALANWRSMASYSRAHVGWLLADDLRRDAAQWSDVAEHYAAAGFKHRAREAERRARASSTLMELIRALAVEADGEIPDSVLSHFPELTSLALRVDLDLDPDLVQWQVVPGVAGTVAFAVNQEKKE